MRRVVIIVLSILGVLLLLAGAGAAWMIGPRNLIGMWRYDQRREGSLKVGDRAPDVTLLALDGTTEVRIHDHVGEKPLILIFGSYT